MIIRSIVSLALIAGISFPAIANDQILATSYSVQDLDTGEILRSRNDQEVRSIASITKLMTAVVVLDSGIDLTQEVVVKPIPGMHSKLPKNIKLSLYDLMHLSLMSSDNLATKILAQHYPGGETSHMLAMNAKAREIGMVNTSYTDPTGLDETNVSTAVDLAKLVGHAERYELIKQFSTTPSYAIDVPGKKHHRTMAFHTTNHLVAENPNIILSKTGWIHQAGGCLVMLVQEQGRRLAVVLLNSRNTHTRLRDGELLYGLQHGKDI